MEPLLIGDVTTLSFKVLVIGEPNVGKTAFVKRYTLDTFSHDRTPTNLGVDYFKRLYPWNPKTNIMLQFWDVAGQERLGTQSSVYFRGAHAAIIVYDVTDQKSYAAVPLWKQLVDENVRRNGISAQIPCILLANKIDLVVDCSEFFIPTELDEMTQRCGFACGIPISACGNYNIGQAIKKLVELLLERDAQIEEEERLLAHDATSDSIVTILDGNLPAQSNWCCSGLKAKQHI